MKKQKKKTLTVVIILTAVTIIFAVSCFSCVSLLKALYPYDYDKYVDSSAQKYNLEKSFVFAVIKCESDFDKTAVSNVGARGLMQIMPETFEWLKTKTNEDLDCDSLFEPQVSINYGCLLYSILMSEFSSEETAVAAYHAGIGNVRKWLSDENYSSDGETLKVIPFPSTASYVKKVMRVKKIYEFLYGGF